MALDRQGVKLAALFQEAAARTRHEHVVNLLDLAALDRADRPEQESNHQHQIAITAMLIHTIDDAMLTIITLAAAACNDQDPEIAALIDEQLRNQKEEG